MINSKYVSSLVVALLALVAGAYALRHWGLLPYPGSKDNVPEAQVTSLASPEQSVPDEFIDYDAKASEDAAKNFAGLSTQTLWQNLLTGFHAGNTVQVGLENALIARLRKEKDSTIYNELIALFKPGLLDAPAQQVLASLLGEIGNAHSAQALMRLVSSGLVSDPDVKLSAFHAISKFSPESWQDHPNTEFASVFEAAWQTPDTEFLSAIANVMASIGAPSTLDIFVQTLTENTNEERVEIVKQAMTVLVNPALIPKLASLLNNPSENVRVASAYALANMGTMEAAQEIINMATQADVDKVDLVKDLSETIAKSTPEIMEYAENNLPKLAFKDQQIKQAFIDGINVVQSGVE